ncbi:hypothetical protein ACO2Q3_17410 [Caulobacter sp. KR2-114]|uniref:hypothetical protein n=1 Tax=Caulobacter sp. KR2-114 TaxID=3400912 RepID=UPI003C03083A
MRKLMQGCAFVALLGGLAGQAMAQSQSQFIRPVPVMPAPALSATDEFSGLPDTPLPPGVKDHTLDAQYVRWQAARTAQDHGVDAAARADEGPLLFADNTVSAPAPTAPAVMAAPPAPRPGFDIDPRLLEAASAFDDFMTSAAQVRAQFADGGQVAKVVDAGSSYETRQLETGAIAYAALVALHDPDFVAQVRRLGVNPQDMAEQILAQPQSVMGIPGADQTAARVAAVLHSRGADVMGAGKAVKQSAYDVQHQAWSRAFVADPQGALARVKANSAQPVRKDDSRIQHLLQTVSAGEAGQPGAGTRSSTVTRGMALAALTVLGQAGEANAERVQPLLNDLVSINCLKMAKLNFYQCMAVAGPQYEDLFCVGQHGLMDTGGCMISAADDTSGVAPMAIRTADAQGGERELTEREAIERGYAH